MENTKNPYIFIVEDNYIYRNLMISYLKTNKLTNVEAFSSGEEVLKNVHKKPDIIIQDYLLEGIIGLEVMSKFKKVHPSTKFIFLSGQDSIENAVNCMRHGAYDYIVKDQAALQKLVHKIHNIELKSKQADTRQGLKIGVYLFFIGLALLIILTIFIAVRYPQVFGV